MFIEQSMVLGNSRKFCAALVVPDFQNIRNYLQLPSDMKASEMLKNELVLQLIKTEVDKANSHVPQWEQIKKYHLLERAFTIDSGEMTPTLKIKRNVVSELYKDKIEHLYV